MYKCRNFRKLLLTVGIVIAIVESGCDGARDSSTEWDDPPIPEFLTLAQFHDTWSDEMVGRRVALEGFLNGASNTGYTLFEIESQEKNENTKNEYVQLSFDIENIDDVKMSKCIKHLTQVTGYIAGPHEIQVEYVTRSSNRVTGREAECYLPWQ